MMKVDIDLNQMKAAIDMANELVEKLKEARTLSDELRGITNDCMNFSISEKPAGD